MIEVEIKFPQVADCAVAERLAALGARPDQVLEEIDLYFNAPDRDFARTDEALRLRRIADTNQLTYKGPKLDTLTKTRPEIEIELQPGEAAARQVTTLLEHLGYRPGATVRKRRRVHRLSFQGFEVEVLQDQVERLGDFVEIEILAEETRLDAAREAVLALAAELGLGESERRSYLELLLAGRPGSGAL